MRPSLSTALAAAAVCLALTHPSPVGAAARQDADSPFAIRVVDEETAQDFLSAFNDGEWSKPFLTTVDEDGRDTGGAGLTRRDVTRVAQATERNLQAAQRFLGNDDYGLREAYSEAALMLAFVEPAIGERLAARGAALGDDDSHALELLAMADCEAKYRLGRRADLRRICGRVVALARSGDADGELAWLATLRILLADPASMTRAEAERFLKDEAPSIGDVGPEQLSPITRPLFVEFINDVATVTRHAARFSPDRAALTLALIGGSSAIQGDESGQRHLDAARAIDAAIQGPMTPRRAFLRMAFCSVDAQAGRQAAAIRSCLEARRAYEALQAIDEAGGLDEEAWEGAPGPDDTEAMIKQIDGLLDALGGR